MITSPSVAALTCIIVAGLVSAMHRNTMVDSPSPTCRFTLGDHAVDLCPIFRALPITIPYDAQRPGVDRVLYKIGFTDPSREHGARAEQCTEDTWICMQSVPSRSPDKDGANVIAVGRIAPHHRIVFEDGSHRELDKAALIADLEGDYYQDQRQSVRIRFLCDPTTPDSEPARPFVVGEKDGVHSFTWLTSHACGIPIAASEFVTTFDEGSEQPPEQDESDQLRDNLPASRSRRRTTVIIVVLSSCGILALAYLLYSPQSSLRQFLSRQAIPFRFRVGESRLVRWAHEDLVLLERGEEDVMVNHYGDEEIPLKPSPRHSFLHQQYGSVL